jgi:hypothetical protein
MPFPDETTLRTLTAPTVVAIGCPPPFAARCGRLVERLGALFVTADVAGAPTVVAEKRPLAMVVVEDVYDFDPDEFDALARDVGASVVKVAEDVSAARLDALLAAAIDAATARRRAAAAREGGLPSQRRPGLRNRETPPPLRARWSAGLRPAGRRRPAGDDREPPARRRRPAGTVRCPMISRRSTTGGRLGGRNPRTPLRLSGRPSLPP